MNNCPNCGSKANQGDAFCKICGTKLPLPQNIENNTFQYQQYQNIAYNNEIDEEYLIDSYIGKNADKLKKGNFSINTLLFGSLYVLYRKMWLLGFIWLTINITANIFLSSIALYITIIVKIIISTQFKKYYLKHVKEQVDKIKTENPNKTKEQLMIICSQKGGTTLIPVIIAIIVYGITIFIAVASILSIYNRTPGTLDDLKVTIPNNLTMDSFSYDEYKSYHTNSNIANEYCTLGISTYHAFYYDYDAKQYLENRIKYSSSDYSEIRKKRINKKYWYYTEATTEFNTKNYYYVTEKNGTIYEVKFNIYNDTNKACTNAYNTIINSLEFK